MKSSGIILILLTGFCSSVSVGQTDFQVIFVNLGVTGSTTIYDYSNKEWVFTDKEDAKKASLPASTFKIQNSLFALEYNILKDENEIFKWDGASKYHLDIAVNAWNQDSNLKSAYKNSTIWFYEEISQRIPRTVYKDVLKECGYGNGNLSHDGADFWNYGEFAVTPEEIIRFLVKLYENKLPFSEGTVEKIKELMITEQTETHIYRGKTGWTRTNGMDIGWWVGYLETKNHVYFFATRLLKDEKDLNPNFLMARKEITTHILDDLRNRKKKSDDLLRAINSD